MRWRPWPGCCPGPWGEFPSLSSLGSSFGLEFGFDCAICSECSASSSLGREEVTSCKSSTSRSKWMMKATSLLLLEHLIEKFIAGGALVIKHIALAQTGVHE